MPQITDYLKPEIIQQVARLDFKAKFIVEGFFAGLHSSPFHGFSVEFSEHRKYVKGDDPRYIDWNVYAKTDKYYIKKFQAETSMDCYMLIDMSQSMAYKSPGSISKLEYAIYLAASLGFMMLHQQDAVGLVTFDHMIQTYIDPRSKSGQLTKILGELVKIQPSSFTDLAKCISEVAGLIRKKGLIILFSDLLAKPEDVLDGLNQLTFKKNDVIVFHILDHWELDFPFSGVSIFKDNETDYQRKLDPKSVRKDYLEKLNALIDTYKRECENADIDYVLLDTSVTFDKALMSFLMTRTQRII